jgi:hypothetical protein
MRKSRIPSRQSPREIADVQFLQHRAALLDVAAFLDRMDRATADHDAEQDARAALLEEASRILADGAGDRARRILEFFSDPTTEPIAKADGKGASGVWKGREAAR